MATHGKEEKASLNFSSHKRSYGTAGAGAVKPKPVETIRHEVCQGDTLQGIALRYGVSVEDIRHENKLWASDSMHLRPHLMIPIPHRSQPQAASASSSRGSSPALAEKGKVRKKQRSDGVSLNASASPSPVPSSAASSSQRSSPGLPSVSAASSSTASQDRPGELDKSSASSFFASFDTQLSATKSAIRQFESTVDQRVDELGATANAEAQVAAEEHAKRSVWEQKKSGAFFSSQSSGIRRFLPSSKGTSGRGVSKTDSKTQAALEAENEALYSL